MTADEIKKFGYRTLGDILRSVRGFYVTYDRNYSYVGVRGLLPASDYNTRLLLLIDGHRLNENLYDSVYVGTEAVLDVDLIERMRKSSVVPARRYTAAMPFLPSSTSSPKVVATSRALRGPLRQGVFIRTRADVSAMAGAGKWGLEGLLYGTYYQYFGHFLSEGA